MPTLPRVLISCIAALTLALVGCEESTGSSTSTPPKQGSGPQSQLGKSVEMGKDLREQIQGRDMAAGAMAGAISGGDGAVQVGNISIPIPAGWTKVTPSNSMRLAQYEAEGGMMGTPTYHNDYGVRGAIIDTGATKAFIKMTGPFTLVDDHAANFENMVKGIARQ